MKPSLKTSTQALKQGQPVLCLLKDSHDKTYGALLLAAENASPASVNLLIREGKGVVCAGITSETAARLDLFPMIPASPDDPPPHAICTVSVDAKDGITTGISAGDRAHTLRLMAAPTTAPDDLVRPGHLFPYITHPYGVLGRPEMAEAAVDMAKLAGLVPVGAFCGVLDTTGALADETYLHDLADRADLAVFTIDDLVEYRLEQESFVQRSESRSLQTRHGSFDFITYTDRLHQTKHSVLSARGTTASAIPTVYAHKACLEGDVFGALCGCGERLAEAQDHVKRRGGFIVYVAEGGTTSCAHAHAIVGHILADLGTRTISLINPWPGLAESLGQRGFTVIAADDAGNRPTCRGELHGETTIALHYEKLGH